MSDILDYVADQLGIPRATTHHEVRIRQGLTLDGELRADGHRYLVQTTGGVARWDHISKLSLALQLLGTQENERDETLTALLVAAAIPPEIREAAKTANIQTIVAPAELLENVAREGTPILLTKPKSWAIIIGLLSRQVWPNIRALAEATKTSKSWTQVVVSDLAARGILEKRRGFITLTDSNRLMDRVASERPLQSLKKIEVETGIDSWEELWQFMADQWSPTLARMERPGLWACGATAAMAYSNYLARHDRLHAYTDSPEILQAIFKNRKGGIPITLYKPDRPMGHDATTWNGIHVTSLPQTILDLMGAGFSARDATRSLLEVLHA